MSLDLGEDCCAPGSEIKKCTRGYTAYCKEGDRNCCPYVCCDSQPEGYYKPTQLPRYLWATFSTCLSLLLLIITVFIARLKDSRGLVYSTQTRGLGRDAKRRIKRLLDAELLTASMNMLHLITYALFYGSSVLWGLVLIIPTWAVVFAGTVFGLCSGASLKSFFVKCCVKCCMKGALPCYFVASIILWLLWTIILSFLVWKIPGNGLLLAFIPSILWLNVTMIHHSRMLPKALEAKDDESPEEYTYDWGGLRILTGIKEELEVRDSCNSGTNDHGEEVRNLKQWLTERLHEIRRTADEGQLAEKEAEASRAEILALSKLLSHFKAKVDREIEGEIQL